MSDSAHHFPKFSMQNLREIAGVLSETFWLSYKNDDQIEMPKALKKLNNYSNTFEILTSYVSKSDLNLKINSEEFEKRLTKYLNNLNELDILSYIKENTKNLMDEALQLLKLLEKKIFKKLKLLLIKLNIFLKALRE